MIEVTPAMMAIYLGAEFDQADVNQCQMFIDDVVSQALDIAQVGDVDPDTGPTHDNLPAGALGVVRGAVARLMLNPMGVSSESAGSFSHGGITRSGSLLSASERNKLLSLSGKSRAFTIDLLPQPQDAS